MVIRVFRARVRAGKGSEFEAMLRRLSIPRLQSQAGLVAWYAGRPFGLPSEEFAVVTIWKDMDALKKYTGKEWEKAVIPDEELPVLAETFLHHYESID